MTVCTSTVSQLSGRQITTFLRLFTLSPMTCLALPYLATLSHKRHDFRKIMLLNLKYVFLFLLQRVSDNSSS